MSDGPRPPAGWRSRGYLPHYDGPGVVQHIVFRLADSLPREVMAELDGALSPDRIALADHALDRGFGARHLADPAIARLIRDSLFHFDSERYRLEAWCVMPNHVHVLAEPSPGCSMSTIVKAWKSFTSRQALRQLGRTGPFWAPEYYDRFMRDDAQFQTTRAYIETNPESAGLHDWPWRSRNSLS